MSEALNKEFVNFEYTETVVQEIVQQAPEVIDFDRHRKEIINKKEIVRGQKLKNAFKRLASMTDRVGDAYENCRKLLNDYNSCQKEDKDKYYALAKEAIYKSIDEREALNGREEVEL